MKNNSDCALSKEFISEIKSLGVSEKGEKELIVLKSQIKTEIDRLFDRVLSDILIENTKLKNKNDYLEMENHTLKKKLCRNA